MAALGDSGEYRRTQDMQAKTPAAEASFSRRRTLQKDWNRQAVEQAQGKTDTRRGSGRRRGKKMNMHNCKWLAVAFKSYPD